MGYFLACLLIAVAGLPALLSPAVISSLVRDVTSLRQESLVVGAGLLAGGTVYGTLLPSFWRTLHHELAHLLVAMLVGARPTTLVANEGGGNVRYRLGGPFIDGRGFLISLAPYAASPFAAAVLLAVPVLSAQSPITVFLVSVAAGAAITAPLLELNPRQEDLRRYGLLFAVPVALWLWAGITVVLLSVLAGSVEVADLARLYARAGRHAVATLGGLFQFAFES
jgi:hypothetical protein